MEKNMCFMQYPHSRKKRHSGQIKVTKLPVIKYLDAYNTSTCTCIMQYLGKGTTISWLLLLLYAYQLNVNIAAKCLRMCADERVFKCQDEVEPPTGTASKECVVREELF
jgi:hypothetical protein